MMLDPMATQHVPSLPPANPAPIDIHLDDDMNTDTNSASDATMSTSKTATSPAPMSAGSTCVKIQTNVQIPESAVEINQPPIPSPAEIQSTSDEVKMEIDGDKSEANANPESVEETNSASSTPPKYPELGHITPTPAHDTTSEDDTERENGGDTDARATITQSTEVPADPKLEGPKPVVAEVVNVEATKIESDIESPAGQKPELSNTEATDHMNLDVVENSGGEVKNAFSHDHDPNTPAEEVTHGQGGSDHQQIAFKNVGPVDAPLPTPEQILGASQSDDTTTEVSRIHATYDSSGESRTSGREEEKMEDDSVSGTQDEDATTNGGKVVASEPAVDNDSKALTSESTAEKEEEETILPTKTRGSLFGGPDGKRIPPTAEAPEAPKVDSIAPTGTSEGFEELFEDDMAEISTESERRIQLSQSLDTGDINFETNDTEGNAEPDVKEDVEPEAVLGAQQEALNPSLSSDHDAKPDTDDYQCDTSPTPSHTTSNNSQESQKTSASRAVELNNMINSGNLFSHEPKDFPPEFFDLDQPSSGTDQPVLPTIEEEQHCYCQPGLNCPQHVIKAFGLRPGPRKNVSVPFGIQIPDTDKSGDYTDDIRWYPSTKEVAPEDRDEDEPSVEDGEGDHFMSGGLISDDTDLLGRFSNTVPFNKTDPLIRDKAPFGEESSSEDESTPKKSKKRKKKGKSTREAKRPKITDITDDESDTQPTQRMRARSFALPHLSTTLGTLAESLRNRQTESRASKPTKKSPTKRKQKTTITSPTPQP
ncbi:hypothetical protein KCU91_g16918, partial [Aureobasidium melanogenum]